MVKVRVQFGDRHKVSVATGGLFSAPFDAEVAAECEAVHLYMQLADSTDNKLAVEALKDIADEERVHAGEFLRLLRELAPR